MLIVRTSTLGYPLGEGHSRHGVCDPSRKPIDIIAAGVVSLSKGVPPCKVRSADYRRSEAHESVKMRQARYDARTRSLNLIMSADANGKYSPLLLRPQLGGSVYVPYPADCFTFHNVGSTSRRTCHDAC